MRQVHGACPLNCPDGCAWTVTVDDGGRAVKLRGRADHPFTRGGLCVKVNPYLDHVAAADRLMTPLRRVGPKGAGRFEPVSWDDALDEVATRLRDVIDRHGAEAIWPYTGTGTVGWLQGHGAGRRLWRHLGASFHVINICSVAGHAGMSYTTGSAAGLDPEDIVSARLVLLWGANVLTSNQHLWPFIEQARRDGAHVVSVDPVRTRTAARSDEHLAPRPGTDGALALGLMSHMAAAGGVDEAYLADRTVGWPEFRASLSEWSPERAAAVTGVPVGDIRVLAERIARTRPTVVKLSMGMQRHRGGGQAARVISCLPALNGDYGMVGGGAVYSTAPFYDVNVVGFYGMASGPDGARPRTLQMTHLGRVLDDADPPVAALVIHAANPAVSNPDQRRVHRNLASDDLFTVVIDNFHTDTTAYADIVLPSTMQVEHADVNDSYAHAYIHWNEPAVAAPGECLSPTEIFRRLARAMGVDDAGVLADDEELARSLLDSPSPRLAGVTLEELRTRGVMRLGVEPHEVVFGTRFPTASGRFEFTSRRAERDGYGLLPGYTPPGESPGDGQLSFLAAADHHLLNSQFANRERHLERSGEIRLLMHPADAAVRGLHDGQTVTVDNARGTLRLPLAVDDRVREGTVATTKGRWGDGPNQLTSDGDADMAEGAVFHDTAVTVSAR